MSVEVTLTCDGCFKTAPPYQVSRKFVSFLGRNHGFGFNQTESIEAGAPSDWVVFDPFTHCTYCPECWQSICARTLEGWSCEQ